MQISWLVAIGYSAFILTPPGQYSVLVMGALFPALLQPLGELLSNAYSDGRPPRWLAMAYVFGLPFLLATAVVVACVILMGPRGRKRSYSIQIVAMGAMMATATIFAAERMASSWPGTT